MEGSWSSAARRVSASSEAGLDKGSTEKEVLLVVCVWFWLPLPPLPLPLSDFLPSSLL